jgi:hypothetical protein
MELGLDRVVTFMGNSGNRRADVLYDDIGDRFVVKFFIKAESMGMKTFLTEDEANNSAEAFTFRG